MTARELLLGLLDELDRKAATFEELEAHYDTQPCKVRCREKGQMCRDLAAGWRQAYRAVLEGEGSGDEGGIGRPI
jgi:hypothetical protein